METQNKRCNDLVLGPSCTTWAPPWLIALSVPTPIRVAAEPKLAEPPAEVSPWDLTPDLYERWEERVCIMHFDGKIPWKQAEALALADVVRNADPPAAAWPGAASAPEIRSAEEPAATVQPILFATEERSREGQAMMLAGIRVQAWRRAAGRFRPVALSVEVSLV